MQTQAHTSPLLKLRDSGCVPYLDYLDRRLLRSGGLRQLIAEDGISGVTTNPVIFASAIRSGSEYDVDIAKLSSDGAARDDILLRLMIDDVRSAADELAPVYDESRGQHGYVSLEVLPELAEDADATVAMAVDLFRQVDRPNALIKVPATRSGLNAVEELIGRGIGVNVTTIFGVKTYEDVFSAYVRGLARGGNRPVPSVASFFVSRIDASVDATIQRRIAEGTLSASFKEFLGEAALASARLVHHRYCELGRGGDARRPSAGVDLSQRLLWGSTASRNPAYRDVKYVEGVAFQDTIATIPMVTLDAFRDHGVVDPNRTMSLDRARQVTEALDDAGISMADVSSELLSAVLDAFGGAIEELRGVIASRIEGVQ
jgi:transaldolase